MQPTMVEALELSAWFASALTSSFFISKYLVELKSRRAGRVNPLPGSIIRFRSDHGMFRARLLGISDAGWRVSAPLSRDAHMPIRIGERVVVEAAHDRGALLFESTVVARSCESHELVFKAPVSVHPVERRASRRQRFAEPQGVKVDHRASELLDLTEIGARLRCDRAFSKGDRIRVDLPYCDVPTYAWVLDAEGAPSDMILRVRFESYCPVPKSKETAPAV